MTRRMAIDEFRVEQEQGRYAPHVRPINELVDQLRGPQGRGWMPYVAPCHGGIEARVLSVLRDPGPKTQDGSGSGFLCIENDDPTAELSCQLFEAVGLSASDITPWNAYPWYINRKPNRAEREAGLAPLLRMIDLLTKIQVVFLQGRDADRSWQLLTRRHPQVNADGRLTVIWTFHPSPQALRTPSAAVRAARIQHRVSAYRQVAAALSHTLTSADAALRSRASPSSLITVRRT